MKLEIGIDGDALMVRANGLNGTDRLTIHLTAPMLKSIETFNDAGFILNGSVDVGELKLCAWNSSLISIGQNITAREVEVQAYNNGRIDIKSIVADKMRIEAANSAVVNVSGKVNSLTKNVMNGAKVNADSLSDARSGQSSYDDSDDTVIVYSEDISLFGRLTD